MKCKLFYKWKEGMKNLSLIQIERSKLIGAWGGVVGLVLAMFFLWLQKSYVFLVFLFFILWGQVVNAIQLTQEFERIKKVQDEINKINKGG